MSLSLLIQGLQIYTNNHKTRTVTMIRPNTRSAVRVPTAHSVDNNRNCRQSVCRG